MLSIVKGPYLQWPTLDGMTVMWETSGGASSAVECWETERVHAGLNGGARALEDSRRLVRGEGTCRIHRVTLNGLAPATTYHYRVRSEADGTTVSAGPLPLRTAPPTHQSFSFAVLSETGGYGDDQINRDLFDRLADYRPDLLLMVGDAVSRGSLYEDWERWFFGPGRKLLASTPFYLVPGNHEENSPWFYRFVAYPEPRNYYAFDYANAHFVGLDSTCGLTYSGSTPTPGPDAGGFGPGSAQHDFLVRQLAGSRAEWKFVFFHYPPYVSADYQVEQMRVLCPALEAYGVDIVFNSHTIVYERSHPLRAGRVDFAGGVRYIVAGGAGAKPEWFNPKRAWHTAQAVAVPHFVQLVVAGRHLELHAIDQHGRHFDALVLDK
jgi:acid phosphatase type 7